MYIEILGISYLYKKKHIIRTFIFVYLEPQMTFSKFGQNGELTNPNN